MYLRPSEIRFSQDSIGRTFGCYTSHPYRPIGDTLDDIITGKINVNSIPTISVCKRNGHWFTADNRRLWVFQEAEKRGKCTEIHVKETFYIDIYKMTTINNGISVDVRGNPGGFRWKIMPVQKIQRMEFPKPIFSSTPKTPISSNHIVYERHVEELDRKKVLFAKYEHNVKTTNGWSTPKLVDSPYIEREISRDVKNRPEDIETQYCVQDNFNSKLKNEDVKQLADFSSSGFGASQRQEIAPIGERIYLKTQIHSTETTSVTTMEKEKLSKIGKTEDKDDVIKVSEMQTYPTNETFLTSNLEPVAQIKNRYSVHEDSDSENETLELELLDCSWGFNASQAQDNVSDQLHDISKSNSTDKNIDGTKEEKIKEYKWDKQMIVESVGNVFYVPKIPINGDFQSSNSEEYSLMGNMNATVTMTGAIIPQPPKNTNSKSIMLSFICLLIFVGLFVALGIIIDIKFA